MGRAWAQTGQQAAWQENVKAGSQKEEIQAWPWRTQEREERLINAGKNTKEGKPAAGH